MQDKFFYAHRHNLRQTTKIFLLFECSLRDIIVESIELKSGMTFSEFITLHGRKQYLEYCKINNIVPILDVKVRSTKVCALLDKNFKPQTKKPKNA